MTDHCPVYTVLDSGGNPSGKGYWKFPDFLVKDKEYRTFITKRITDFIELNKQANPALLWDAVKCEIRGATSEFLRNRKLQRKGKIEYIEATLASLTHYRISYPHGSQKYIEITADIHDLEKEFTRCFETPTRSYKIGCTQADSEKPTKYFLGRLSTPGSIQMLYNERDEPVSSDREINEICRSFYDQLYADHPLPDRDLEYAFIPPIDSDLRLSENQREDLDQDITIDELHAALLSMKSGKSPGMDGITVAFLKEFWPLVGPLIHRSLMYAKTAGAFSISQK